MSASLDSACAADGDKVQLSVGVDRKNGDGVGVLRFHLVGKRACDLKRHSVKASGGEHDAADLYRFGKEGVKLRRGKACVHGFKLALRGGKLVGELLGAFCDIKSVLSLQRVGCVSDQLVLFSHKSENAKTSDRFNAAHSGCDRGLGYDLEKSDLSGV